MRDIYFRGKAVESGGWVAGGLMRTSWGSDYILPYNRSGEPTDMAAVEVDPKTIGQYTGMKDKHGSRVYEGDIVQDGNGVYYIVEYDAGRGAYECITTRDDCFKYPQMEKGVIKDCEVVGNRYGVRFKHDGAGL